MKAGCLQLEQFLGFAVCGIGDFDREGFNLNFCNLSGSRVLRCLGLVGFDRVKAGRQQLELGKM